MTTLAAVRPELARLGVTQLALFGSQARGHASAQSDVDILVDFAATPSFGEWLDVRDTLSRALGRPVDLVMRTAVKPRQRAAIEREALRVA